MNRDVEVFLTRWTHLVFIETMTYLPSSGKPLILGRVDQAVSNELGLGELAGLTVANEADTLAYDVSHVTSILVVYGELGTENINSIINVYTP